MRLFWFIIALAILLCGCMSKEERERYRSERENTIVADARASMICVDGVQYIAWTVYMDNVVATPHLKPDGKPYTCGEERNHG